MPIYNKTKPLPHVRFAKCNRNLQIHKLTLIDQFLVRVPKRAAPLNSSISLFKPPCTEYETVATNKLVLQPLLRLCASKARYVWQDSFFTRSQPYADIHDTVARA